MAGKKVPVCPHCGSKNVKTENGFYRCRDCSNDFGRTAMSDEGIPMIDAVTGLRFRYGDAISGSVHLRFAEDEGSCVFEVYDANEGGSNKHAEVIPMKTWMALKRKLFEELYVADWNREYMPVNDGQSVQDNNTWDFSVIVNENEEILYRGVDAYPVYWKELLALLDPYLEKLKQE
jgi:DNA-directed RNA polymerase subunit RPC12/RpoP